MKRLTSQVRGTSRTYSSWSAIRAIRSIPSPSCWIEWKRWVGGRKMASERRIDSSRSEGGIDVELQRMD